MLFVCRTMHNHVTLALTVYVITVFSFVLVLLRACSLTPPTRYSHSVYFEQSFFQDELVVHFFAW